MNLKAQIDSNTVIAGDINSLMSSLNRSFRQNKIKEETSALIDTLDH
jgi:hypothetical protein